jgi:oligopeptide transport system substrate-binding protein
MKKAISLILAMILALGMLAGCGDQGSTQPSQGSDQPSQGSEAQQPEQQQPEFEKIFRYADTSSTQNCNPFNNNTSIVDYLQAKLYNYYGVENAATGTTKTVIRPELAAKEPYTKDGDDYTWYIELRQDLKWANGDPINADDFIYSWQEALNPNVKYSATSSLAENQIAIENALDYYKQEPGSNAVKWEDVGLKKIDDYTLMVKCTQRYTAENVMRHFQMRYTSLVYKPIYEQCFNADKTENTYATSADTIMSCGPFELSSWTVGAERVFKKNPNYVYADEIKLDGMHVRVVSDDATALELFKAGEIAYLSLGTSSYEVYAEDPRTISGPGTTVRGIEFNFTHPTKKYLDDVRFRQALYFATDRDTIAKMTNNIAAPYFLPTVYSMSSDGTMLRDMDYAKSYLPANNGFDKEKAKALFDEIYNEYGKIEVRLVYNEAVSALRLTSEYLQSSWEELFGKDRFSVQVIAMNNSEAVKQMRYAWQNEGGTDSWELCWGAWDLSAAVVSANRKFERYTSYNSNRFTAYHNDFIDEAYKQSITEEYRLDEDKLVKITLDMEKSLIENVDQLPVFQAQAFYIFSDRCVRPTKTRLNFVGFQFERFDLTHE